jgi:DNA helicase-2/ATP-dependent DNA helicase PcrA
LLEQEAKRLKTVPLINERDTRVEAIKKKSKTLVSKYISKLPKFNLMFYFQELMTNFENLKNYGETYWDDDFIKYIRNNSIENFILNKNIEFEDLAGLLYMKYKIFGMDKNINTKYIVIDEAQDFSLFQVYCLMKVFNTKMFTLLGDLAQGIHSYMGIERWTDLLEQVFQGSRGRIITIEQSYRTTIEIMNFANKILEIGNISGVVLAKPVVRHGDEPTIKGFDSIKALIDALDKKIFELEAMKFQTIAIIGKSISECKDIQKSLNKNKGRNIRIIGSEDNTYEGGISIVPSYMAKGLEFDAVIIISANEDYFEDELDIKLLYIAVTRALHKTDVMCCNGNLNILNTIKKTKP